MKTPDGKIGMDANTPTVAKGAISEKKRRYTHEA